MAWRPLITLFYDEEGQDLVEYGLLALFIGLAGIATWQAIVTGLGTSYSGYDADVQSLWVPGNPS
jgi:Flp pilus assembly pilin Flp